MIKVLEDRFYYLNNFHIVLDWIKTRYADLFNDEEKRFIEHFPTLPIASRALLVRMIMRKGALFRSGKLKYDEIGCPHTAAVPLVTLGWIDDKPLLTLEQLFGLVKKTELPGIFPDFYHASRQANAVKKINQLEVLRPKYPDARHFGDWNHGDNGSNDTNSSSNECVYQLQISNLCDRLRLMFFGNLHQDWTEFVLADLGVFTYEKVAFSASSRGFQNRADVDDYLHLHQCRERLINDLAGADCTTTLAAVLAATLSAIPTTAYRNACIEGKRSKLLYRVAQQYEKNKQWQDALHIYTACRFPGARVRAIRMHEHCQDFKAALALANQAGQLPESEAEQQQLARILPRLARQLGHPRSPPPPATAVQRLDLCLPRPKTDYPDYADYPGYPVEYVVRDHLAQAQPDTQVFYVENTLINALFGLLCWDAIFCALPGAFFHPFQSGPADLYSPDFQQRRQTEFDLCLAQLDSQQYRHTITTKFMQKAGIQSPFVAWEHLTQELLELALHCLPADHLKLCITRILQDIQSNRSGLPDLIQFMPDAQCDRRYQMIEVKGPGDRLQDNQIRWIDFFNCHHMPVMVCYVQWREKSGA